MRSLLPVLFALLFPVISHAYSYIDNRGLLPIGEVEAYMANTGVALSGSTGAVYYNPAGLASLTQPHLSISANSYLKTSGDITPMQTFDGTQMDFHVEGLQTIPTSFVSTGVAGPFHYAFSILIPHQLKVQDSRSYSSPHYPTMQYSRTNAFQLIEIGPSVATRFGGTYDAGIGCFFALYTTTQSNSFTAGTNGGTNALVSNSYYDASSAGLMCNAGVQVRMTEALRVGATLRSPFIGIKQSGTSMLFVQTPNGGQSATDGPKDVTPSYAVPTDLSIGAEYKFSDAINGYGDLSYQFSATQNTGMTNAADSKNDGTVRGSVGVSLAATPSLNLYGGFGYNPSSVVTTDDDYSENYVVGTVGTRWSTTNTNFGIGLLYAHSTGEKKALAYDYQLNPVPSDNKTGSVSTTAFGILLSSGYLF